MLAYFSWRQAGQTVDECIGRIERATIRKERPYKFVAKTSSNSENTYPARRRTLDFHITIVNTVVEQHFP